MVSGISNCLRTHGIPRALGRRADLLVGREVGALCVERLAVFVPSLPHPLLSTVNQCDGCLSYLGRGGSWLGCRVLPAISAVSILELVADSGNSRMSRAPNLHSLRQGDKLFIIEKTNLWCSLFSKIIVSLICWKIKIHNFPAQFPNNKTVQAQNQAIIG